LTFGKRKDTYCCDKSQDYDPSHVQRCLPIPQQRCDGPSMQKQQKLK
jgi:hypothetical protein